jgi:MFS family permease
VVYGFAGVPFGLIADRTSRRNLIFWGVIVWSAGTIGCGYSNTFAELFAARIVVGLGESVLSPAAISLISDYFPPSRRGFAVACFLSGIAIGIGSSILIGGGVLDLVEAGVFSGTSLGALAPWRLVLLLIGVPGLVWAFLIFTIREPARRAAEPTDKSLGESLSHSRRVGNLVIPIYLVVAMASLVDNAVGAWSPTLLIRTFSRDPAAIGLQLGLGLTLGFGGGVLLGGWLSDKMGLKGGWPYKLGVCLAASALIMPIAAAIDSAHFRVVMAAVPLYFAVSGIVTACGFSSILDAVPNHRRGFAMAVSFFLNVALGAGIGPSSVALASAHVFGEAAGLGPAVASVVASGYAIAAGAIVLTLLAVRRRSIYD